MKQSNLAVLILAAGESSRLGQPKQLLKYKNTTLLAHTIQCAKAISDKLYVVLGGNKEAILKEVDFESIRNIYNPTWKEGIGNSISFGIGSIMFNHPNIDSIMILLSDQPKVSPELLKKLYSLHEFNEKQITACRYSDTYGVPAIFKSSLFDELRRLNGDKGAKTVINGKPDDRQLINFEDGKIDIDTPSDLQFLE